MMRTQPRIAENGQRGFTLVEVLAALAIASLVLVSLNLASSAVRRGVETTRESLGSQAQISAALGIFRRDAASILKLRREAQGYVFEGSAKEITYPLAEPRGPSSGGLFLVRLRALETEGTAQLVRDRAPVIPGAPLPVSGWRDEVVLLEGPFTLDFAYRAPRSGGRMWQDNWSGENVMPEQIRLTIGDRATGRLRVPVAVQPLLIDAELECADSADCGLAKTGAPSP